MEKTYTCSEIQKLISSIHKPTRRTENIENTTLNIRTIRGWFKYLPPVGKRERANLYGESAVADILAEHGIPELKMLPQENELSFLKDKISSLENTVSSLENKILALQSELEKQVNTNPMINQNNDSNIAPAEEALLKSRLLEEFITKKTDYEFCSKRFEQDFHNKSAYDNSITNLFASSSEKSKLKKAAERIENYELTHYFQKKKNK